MPLIIIEESYLQRFSHTLEIIQQIILIHEIGHALLHQKTLQIKCFHDFELFDGVSQCEYEANCFAADYLLEDEDVLEIHDA